MEKSTILIVDDTAANIEILASTLNKYHKIKVALNGLNAIKIAHIHPQPDLILLDIMMPEMDGYEVCEILKGHPNTKHIPIIFVTAKTSLEDETRGLELGAVDYITKPIHPPITIHRVNTYLNLANQNKLLSQQIKKQIKNITNAKLEVIQRLGRAAEYKDNKTGMHVKRVSHYSHLIAKKHGMSDIDAEMLLNAASVHDIGKIGITDEILLKPGPLTTKEWEKMKQHVEIGGELLSPNINTNSELISLARIIVLTHHEKYNGSGYPKGLKEEDIPISGRIIALADAFDAMTSERPYKSAMTVDEAFEILSNEKGKHFDPELTDIFLSHKENVIQIRNKFQDPKEDNNVL